MVVDTERAAHPGRMGSSASSATPPAASEMTTEELRQAVARLREERHALEQRVQQGEQRRRAMIHIMDDLNSLNRKLADQRKAMLHILADYERDRERLAQQTVRLDNSRRALLHILQDVHQSNSRLENGRKAMIHIMSDLSETTAEVQRREQELRDKQEQLVQAGKLATLGELTTGVAHELNNPLNNIGLFVGNAIDRIELGTPNKQQVLGELQNAMRQVRKASEIISHLRTFGRAAPVSHEPVAITDVIQRALSLISEQLRMRQIEVALDLPAESPVIYANAIQLEQVFINLLTNARDALADAEPRRITISCVAGDGNGNVEVAVSDTGRGIPEGLEQRIFDPFFTTKEVGQGTGLGLSITYGIIKEHGGTISVMRRDDHGATFVLQLPRGHSSAATEAVIV